LSERLFGTDGFRGEFDESEDPSTINTETFRQLALEHARFVTELSGDTPLFVIGGDTRISGKELRSAVSAGLTEAGADVWDVGIAPTPAIAWVAKRYGAYAVAVTASHNPADENGYKAFDKDGTKASEDVEREIERRYWKSVDSRRWISGDKKRRFNRIDLIDRYLDATVEELGGPGVLDGKTLLVDGANGAAYELGPILYDKLGASVKTFACRNDGYNINANCGAAQLDGVRYELENDDELRNDENFLGVLAHDGDADRVIGLDRTGRTLNGNHWMNMLAIGQRGIVGTEYTNTALRRAVQESGVKFDECSNGDKNVTALLMQLTREHGSGFSRGGEFTGHLIDLEHSPTGDGLYMGGRMLVHAVTTGASMADQYDALPLWPERMVNLRLDGADAEALLERDDIKKAMESVTDQLSNFGRIVVRASGTERDILRIWVEAADPTLLEPAISQLTDVFQTA
jgi:phosphoglucosamine mutase